MADGDTATPILTIPTGTQVVTRVAVTDIRGSIVRPAGAVGVVVETPGEAATAYRVRFADAGEAWLGREELSIRKETIRAPIGNAGVAVDDETLRDYVILRCVVGSRAYGLDTGSSDIDRRGIYLPPAILHWRLAGVPEQLEDHARQETYWELQKFLVLALKANPNALECLYTPLIELAAPLAQQLLEMRDIFLSRLVYQTYNGYVLSQFKKLETDVRTGGAIKWKHAMHLIRLLLSGIIILHEGFVPVRVETYRERLLAIRRGELPWEEVDRWRLSLHATFDEAFTTTRLPEYPDVGQADAFLLRARRGMVLLPWD
jgi:predicted nucleotidyltransferase